jgi:integrase/recombinase XerC
MTNFYERKEEFLRFLDALKGYSSLTIQSYNESINEMLKYSEITEEEGICRINLTPLRMKIAHLKPKSIARKLSAIRSFIRFVNREIPMVTLRADESIKVPQTLPKPISHHHLMEVLHKAPPMEKLVLLLLYTMGLRFSELMMLRRRDVSELWCRVVGKGNKQRDIPMVEGVYDYVNAYCDTQKCTEFVLMRNGEKLSENAVRYALSKLFKASGLHVTPHQLRHTYATELLNHHARISDVSELLGHASMATTQIYTKLGNTLKMESYLRAHPLFGNKLS